MSEESKYYTPLGNEFHIGFEYEIYEDFDHYPEKSWHKQVYGRNGYDQESIGAVGIIDGEAPVSENFRVKYLDREGFIEMFGAAAVMEDDLRRLIVNGRVIHRNEECDSSIIYNELTNHLLIAIDGKTVFAGKCKNKSELKRIMKMTGLSND